MGGIHPVIDEGVWSYRHVNVAAQRRDPSSFLNWMVRMIRVRKECPEIGWGRHSVVETHADGCLALRYDWRGNAVLVLHNFSEHAREASVRVEGDATSGGARLSDLMREDELLADDDGVQRVAGDALESRWFRIGGLDYTVRQRRRD